MPLDGQDLDYVTLTPVAEELLAAERYLQRYGWCRGIFQNHRGNVCLAPAMIIVRTTSLQIYLDNNILKNFVSMTAPVHEEPYHLFRWDKMPELLERARKIEGMR